MVTIIFMMNMKVVTLHHAFCIYMMMFTFNTCRFKDHKTILFNHQIISFVRNNNVEFISFLVMQILIDNLFQLELYLNWCNLGYDRLWPIREISNSSTSRVVITKIWLISTNWINFDFTNCVIKITVPISFKSFLNYVTIWFESGIKTR